MGLAAELFAAAQREHKALLAGRPLDGKDATSADLATAPPATCVMRAERLGVLQCNCAGTPIVYACDLHGKCTEEGAGKPFPLPLIFDAGGEEIIRKRPPVCRLCADRQEPIAINGDRNGIGDIVLECWYPEVAIYATGQRADVVRMFGGRLLSARPQAAQVVTHLLPAEYAARKPRIEYRAQQLGAKKIRRPSYTISEADHAWAIQRMDADQPGRKNVCLFPDVTHQVRAWPASAWKALAQRLTADGCAVFTLTASTGVTIQQAAALMNLCDLVISADTGAAHMAGTMRIPALVLLGPTLASVYSHVDVQTMVADTPCAGCNFQRPYTSQCERGCRALSALTVDAVYERSAGLLRHVRRYGRKHEIDAAIRLFESRNGRTIVEIGSTRCDKIDAEGCATIAWQRYGANVYSVDTDPTATAYTHALCPLVNAVSQDGIDFLRAFDQRIDLLYLDGLDGDQAESPAWHLRCYEAARDRCNLILIDDQSTKGTLVIDAALRDGWRLISRRYQALLSR